MPGNDINPFGLVPNEEDEQRALVKWLILNNILFAHVPNGGHRNPVTGRKLKELGTSKGFPDIVIFDRPPAKPEAAGTVIELKRQRGGRVTPEQQVWLEALSSRGWVVSVCRGFAEAVRFLESLGYGVQKALKS